MFFKEKAAKMRAIREFYTWRRRLTNLQVGNVKMRKSGWSTGPLATKFRGLCVTLPCSVLWF